jgi:hypothetical protein
MPGTAGTWPVPERETHTSPATERNSLVMTPYRHTTTRENRDHGRDPGCIRTDRGREGSITDIRQSVIDNGTTKTMQKFRKTELDDSEKKD